jgi:fucose 4-O-acetylase-like acetyltransferase
MSATLTDLVAATPRDRDRTVDLLRGVSLVAVALGHWLIAVVRLDADGGLTAGSALSDVPALHLATWLFQVMPLFFLVGGVANLRSWASARARGDGYGVWLQGRLQRLVVPTAAAVAVWCGLGALLVVTGAVSDDLVALAGRTVTLPLWFLAVYVVVVALAPLMSSLHRRHGVRAPLALTSAAVAVDVAHAAGVPLLGSANFLFVWLVPQQVGFAWADGRLAGRRIATRLLAVGLGGLVLLTVVGPYPVSVVGVPGADASNNSPPTVVLIALTLVQVGVVLVAQPALARWLERPRVWGTVLLLNLRALTVYLWHLPVLVAVAALVVPLGLTPDVAAGTTLWWVTRPLWLLQLAVPLVVALPLLGRLERLASTPPRTVAAATTQGRASVARPVVAAVGALLGFALLAGGGLPVPGRPAAGAAALGLASLVAAAVAARDGGRR